MAKMKVHELAKELDIQSKDVITFLTGKGVEVKAAQSSIEDDAIEMVRKKFGKAPAKAEAPAKKEEAPKAPAPKAEAPKADGNAEPPKKKKKIIIIQLTQRCPVEDLREVRDLWVDRVKDLWAAQAVPAD